MTRTDKPRRRRQERLGKHDPSANGRADAPIAVGRATPPGFKADREQVARVRKRFDDAGVQFCCAVYTDVHGIPKAKVTPMSAFEKMCDGAELYTVGAVEGLGLVGPQEDECAAIPDLSTAVVCPWDRTLGWMHADLYHHGAPYPNDPRRLLRRQIERAAESGVRMDLGIEPEFYLLRKDEAGRYGPVTATRFKGPNACYDVRLTHESMAFLRPMVDHLTTLGWGVFSFDQECGRGQHEFDFAHADALTSADRLIFLRTLAKHVAADLGAVASFMPKPFADDFRSGAHFNLSLVDVQSGTNLFDADADHPPGPLAAKHGVRMPDTAYHFVGGLLRHAEALTAVTCPTYNSYQGLIARGQLSEFSWAPVLIAYGRNNRSAMIRCPANRPCVENRAVDMSVNPYLAAALTLAAGLDGIENEIDPGPPLNTDLYRLGPRDLKAAGLRRLPATLLHALEAFDDDPLVAKAFGSYKDVYLAHELGEWEKGFYAVSDAQRDERMEFL